MAWEDFTEWKDGQPIFVDGDPDFSEWKDGEPLTGPVSTVTLVIPVNDLLHFADTFVLNELVIADAYHLHVVDPDPLVLTGAFDLVIADDSLDIFTDPIALTQEHELAVDPCDHLHVVDPDPLSLGFHLPINEAYHSHISDNVGIGVPANLIIYSPCHSIYNDDPLLEFDAVNVSWGDQRSGGGGLLFQSHTNYCGNNVLWPGCKIKINRFYILIGGSHDIQRRLAVYQGADTIDTADAGASESDLVVDFGQTSGTATEQWIYVDAPANTYLNNSHECVWLVTKADDQANNISVKCGLEGSQYDYDFGEIGGHGTTAKVTDDTGTPALDAEETVAFPAAFPLLPDLGDDPAVHSSAGYSVCMYLTFTVTSNTNLIVKPGVSEHFADTTELTEIPYMKVQEAFHLNVPDPIALTQKHELFVNPSDHIHAGDAIPLIMNLLVSLENDHLHFADQADVVPIILVSAADCYHENIPDPIDLVQLHILTVVECYHAHDGPNIALTQEHELAVSEAHSLHFADNVATYILHILVVQESDHIHVQGGLILSKALHLLVAQGWFEHYADTVGLTVHLDVTETHHEHFSDALILSLHLVVAESNHEIATDPLPLLQENSLVVLGAFHDHFVDLADLIEVATLVVDPCFHVHDAESIPLGVHLTIQEAYHEHFVDNIPLIMALLLADAYHLLDSDLLTIGQLHFLEIAGTSTNTSTNYHIVTSDHIDWGYLAADLDHLSLVNATTDRTLEPRTPVLSLKWIQDQRELEDVTIYRTMRKAA